MPLVVRQVNPMVVLSALLGTAVTIALVLLWASIGPGDGGVSPILVLIVAALLWAAFRRVQAASVRLRIDGQAIQLPAPGGRLTTIDWMTVSDVLVTVAGSERTPMTVAVRLRPGAPLPRSVRGRITDPNDPSRDDEQLTAKVGDLRLDGARLQEALRTFAGARVEIRERHIETFRIGGG